MTWRPANSEMLLDKVTATTDCVKLQAELEARLLEGPLHQVLTIPERRLLAGLRLREQYLRSPLYAEQDKQGPGWWLAIIGSIGAALE